jgi:hypothetical protein
MLNLLKDVFSSFQKYNVRYLVIGGIAAVLHGVPRATFDLDILIEANEENAQRLLNALEASRFGTASMINAKELISHEITVFQDRVRIDVQTSTPGIDFSAAWKNKETMNYQGQEFYVLSKADLISSKKAAGRDRDLEDIRLLTLDE